MRAQQTNTTLDIEKRLEEIAESLEMRVLAQGQSNAALINQDGDEITLYELSEEALTRLHRRLPGRCLATLQRKNSCQQEFEAMGARLVI